MDQRLQWIRFSRLNLFAVALGTVFWIGQIHSPHPSIAQDNPFTGTSFRLDSDGVRVSSRGFEASARTDWHTHSAQLLFVKQGQLRYQIEGQPIGEIGLHETTYLPRGVRHWHGATPEQALTHVSITFPNSAGDPLPIEWMEPVTDAQYAGMASQ